MIRRDKISKRFARVLPKGLLKNVETRFRAELLISQVRNRAASDRVGVKTDHAPLPVVASHCRCCIGSIG
jgi:hypothetical protein